MIKKKYKITGIVAAVVIVIAAILYGIASRGVENWLYTKGIAALEEKLGTRIAVDSIDVSLFRGRVGLYGFEMDDRSRVKMLRVDTMRISVDVLALLSRDLIMNEVTLHGATARLYKVRKDTAANYQFVIDAFKSKKKDKTKKKSGTDIQIDLEKADFARMDLSWDVLSARHKGGDTLDTNHLQLKDIHISMRGRMEKKGIDMAITKLQVKEAKSGMTMSIKEGTYKTKGANSVSLLLNGFMMNSRSKRFGFDNVEVSQNSPKLDMKKPFTVRVDSLRYWTNNHKRRKNYGKPNHGDFDAGHLDAVVNLEAEVHSASKDSIAGSLKNLEAIDKGSGLIIKSMTTFFNYHHHVLDLTMVKINMPRTRVKINNVRMILPDKGSSQSSGGKVGAKGIYFVPCRVKAYVCLQDLAQPFTKALSHFTTRMNLSVDAGGPLDNLALRNIRIWTNKSRLRLTAEGEICNVTKKHKLVLHFRDIHLSARSGIKEQIVNHFAKKVNLKMQRQMRAIGDVEFSGHLDIPYKHVLIGGTLFTDYGNIDFDFDINSRTHYMTGTLSGKDLELGKVMNVEKLGPITAKAQYSFDLASKKDAKKRADPGKLPIGELTASVDQVRYGKLHFKDIETKIKSDGAIALGAIATKISFFELTAEFIYKQTVTEQWWKVKPHLTKSKMNMDDVLSKREAKIKEQEKEKKEEKEKEKKAKKAALKAEKEKAKAAMKRIKEQAASLKASSKE